MNKMMGFTLALLASFPVFAKDFCPTHESCVVGNVCECTVAATSAYDRFFYVDFHNLKSNRVYQCNISSFPVNITLRPDLSTFPEGVTYTASNFGLMIDTNKMNDAEGTVIIKYFIPGSDYPSDTQASCKEVG